MYRLVLYGLCLIIGAAFALSSFGGLSLSILELSESLVLLLVSCWSTNYVFGRLYGSTTSVESIWITALILFLTIAPPTTIGEGVVVAFAGALAILSKYVLSIDKKHIFNPAAISLVILSMAGSGLASWWVGSPLLLPVVAIVGFLVVRKIHRFDVLWSFLSTSLILTLFYMTQGLSTTTVLSGLVLSGPLIFFSTIMLTEPLTMPPTKILRIMYGILVGTLYTSQFHIGIFFATPHLALVLGNIYSYFVSSREKLLLRLHSIDKLSANVYEFIFRPNRRLAFTAGQYLEWTLPHPAPDSGGNRRYFTISSSPIERDIRIGVRIDEYPSTFKKALLSMDEKILLTATSLSGDFVLPQDSSQKLLFIAGGVGITPFVSMLRYLMDKKERRDIVLFYIASTEHDFAYQSLIEQAKHYLNLHIVYVAGKRIDPEMVKRVIPDLKERQCYISGPDSMVKAYRTLISTCGVSGRNIRTDYFTGFSSI